MFVAPYRPLSRDDIVARRQQKLCTLDEKVCDTISVLGLRRRAGARRRQRLQAELKVTSLVNTAHCDGEIPVIIGNRSVTPPASRRPTSEEEIPARQQRKQQQRHVSSSRSVDQLKTTMIDDTNHAILFHIDIAATAVVTVRQPTSRPTRNVLLPALYVLNAAAITKPHAIDHLTAVQTCVGTMLTSAS